MQQPPQQHNNNIANNKPSKWNTSKLDELRSVPRKPTILQYCKSMDFSVRYSLADL